LNEHGLIVTAQEHGRIKIFTIDIFTEEIEVRSNSGTYTNWHIQSRFFIGLHDSMTQPAEVVSIDSITWKTKLLTNYNVMNQFLSTPEVLFSKI
jgi:hypothetical protein